MNSLNTYHFISLTSTHVVPNTAQYDNQIRHAVPQTYLRHSETWGSVGLHFLDSVGNLEPTKCHAIGPAFL